MGIQQREINGRALYEAFKTNGVEHIRGDWFTFDADGKPTAGCALGLIAINLKIAGISDQTINEDASLYQQLHKLHISHDSKWYKDGIDVVADTIIYWNDSLIVGTNQYVLPTFEELHEMVHDVLEPFFDTTFVVDEWVPDFNGSFAPPFNEVYDGGDYKDYDLDPNY